MVITICFSSSLKSNLSSFLREKGGRHARFPEGDMGKKASSSIYTANIPEGLSYYHLLLLLLLTYFRIYSWDRGAGETGNQSYRYLFDMMIIIVVVVYYLLT